MIERDRLVIHTKAEQELVMGQSEKGDVSYATTSCVEDNPQGLKQITRIQHHAHACVYRYLGDEEGDGVVVHAEENAHGHGLVEVVAQESQDSAVLLHLREGLLCRLRTRGTKP